VVPLAPGFRAGAAQKLALPVPGSCPEAERAAREVINLPTDRPLGKREILAVLT